MKKFFSYSIFLLLLSVLGNTHGADFSYQVFDPAADHADDYIASRHNIVLAQDPGLNYWKQDIGAETLAASDTGILIYHFPFEKKIADAQLYIRTSTFHWSYSQGHTYIDISTDGNQWSSLLEAEPPEFGSANTQSYNDLLPNSVVGANAIWIRVRLNAYGPSAASGGALTNTAQHSRYDSSANNLTLSLEVNFQSDSGNSSSSEESQHSAENITGTPLVATTISAENVQNDVPANNALITGAADEVTLVDEFNNRVNIKPNSLVTQHPIQNVQDASGKKTTLLRGSIEVNVPGTANDYIIDTPLGQIIVLANDDNRRADTDTQFSANYSQSGFNGSIQIQVNSGSVEVVDRQGNKQSLTGGQELTFNGSVNRTHWVLPIDGDFIHGGRENTLAWLAYPGATGYILEYNFPIPHFSEPNPEQPEFSQKSIYFRPGDYSIWQDLVILPMFIPDLPGSIVEARLFPIGANNQVLTNSVGGDKGTYTFK